METEAGVGKKKKEKEMQDRICREKRSKSAGKKNRVRDSSREEDSTARH